MGCLVDALVGASTKQDTVNLIQPSSFLHNRQIFTVHIQAGLALGREPRFEELPTWRSAAKSSSGRSMMMMSDRVHLRTYNVSEIIYSPGYFYGPRMPS
jgi:hypothetical protein